MICLTKRCYYHETRTPTTGSPNIFWRIHFVCYQTSADAVHVYTVLIIISSKNKISICFFFYIYLRLILILVQGDWRRRGSKLWDPAGLCPGEILSRCLRHFWCVCQSYRVSHVIWLVNYDTLTISLLLVNTDWSLLSGLGITRDLWFSRNR